MQNIHILLLLMYLSIGLAIWSFYKTFLIIDKPGSSTFDADDDDNNGGWPQEPKDPDLDLPPGVFILPPEAPDPSQRNKDLQLIN
ncbi:hypothetical protein [Flammeovirga kamogawensis]|uniref:Uncharacterized protein n=1 Tax=Flammeovirga kamogawensis TaxID=373891 RepID=A0ABX8GU74_9BACT|nr:hypothetical protein [Flammeovirga kamogawensis]MBB6459993.1 hypothetical protein [Flammeovirga kamogawensis]QWG06959.1 hypothetical protein KM029_16860 [Flammeovirga kamogawensis]TRX68779.1 hypothetical protein EO216_11845 [Flammeovirga kamogawensis]